jgi:hypothetical protein
MLLSTIRFRDFRTGEIIELEPSEVAEYGNEIDEAIIGSRRVRYLTGRVDVTTKDGRTYYGERV